MKRKLTALLLAAIFAASLSACAGGGESKPGGNTSQAANPGAGSTENTLAADTSDKSAEGGKLEYPSEDAGPVTWESPLGYSVIYDPTVFTLDDTGEADIFTYNTAETLDARCILLSSPMRIWTPGH